MPQSDAHALFDRGHAALQAGDFREAVECFTRSIAIRGDVAVAYRARAKAYAGLNQRTLAITDLDRAVKLEPESAQIRAERAGELLKQKDYRGVIADCEAAMRLDPGRGDVYGLRAAAYADNGQTERAFADYAKALEADPDNAHQFYTARARLLYQLERFGEVIADADAALSLVPDFTPALELRASARQHTDDLAGAQTDYAAAQAQDPKSLGSIMGLGLLAYQQKRWADVVKAADKLLAVIPGMPQAYEMRAGGRWELGDRAGAIADVTLALAREPNRVSSLSLRGMYHANDGQYAAAVRDHLDALKQDPHSASSFNSLAWLWATAPDPDIRNGRRAKECATRACELSEFQNPTHLDSLAAAHAELGEFAHAAQWQAKALALVPDAERETYAARRALYERGEPFRTATV